MSGNIKDTDVTLIKSDLDALLKDLDNIVKNNESPNDHLYRLEKKYKSIKNTSSALFNLVIKEYTNPNFNKQQFLTNINMMLNTILDIQKSKISQYDGSAKIGQAIAYQYIPQLKKKNK
jgi:hypothetical protein